jgi:hypothetical protein
MATRPTTCPSSTRERVPLAAAKEQTPTRAATPERAPTPVPARARRLAALRASQARTQVPLLAALRATPAPATSREAQRPAHSAWTERRRETRSVPAAALPASPSADASGATPRNTADRAHTQGATCA